MLGREKTEPLVLELSAFEVEMAIEKLKRLKSSGIYQIPAGGRAIRSEIHEFVNSVWNEEELPEQWNESMLVPIHTNDVKTDCSNYRGT
jgi:hypothetical protein